MTKKFRYIVVQHPEDFAVHEAYTDEDGKIIAVNGYPVLLTGYSTQELMDIVNQVILNISDQHVIDGNCEDLYRAWDTFMETAINKLRTEYATPNGDNVIELKR